MAVETATWIGTRLAGRYKVTARLGEGGMGFVYRAHDCNLDSEVVIKVPRAAMLEDPDFAGRFTREVRSLVKLAHPAIVKVTDVGEHDGTPYAVLQYLPGGSLRDRQATDASGAPQPMPAEDLRSWLPAVAEALDFMHGQRFIHRDIKPDNILFDSHGHAFISDFGIAKVLAEESSAKPRTVHTRTGVVLGTPQYMAPEMILGDKYDGSVDQYSLAVTVFEMESGKYPFDGPNPTAIFIQQTTGKPASLATLRPDLPAELCQAVHTALDRDPQKRFPDCMSFARQVLAVLPSSAPRATLGNTADETSAAETVGTMPCPRCGKTVKVPPEARGKRVRCPGCRGVFEIPAPQTETTVAALAANADVKARTPVPQRELRVAAAAAASAENPVSASPGKHAAAPPSAAFPLKWFAAIFGGALLCCVLSVGAFFMLTPEPEHTGSQAKVAHTAGEPKPAVAPASTEDPSQPPAGADAAEPSEIRAATPVVAKAPKASKAVPAKKGKVAPRPPANNAVAKSTPPAVPEPKPVDNAAEQAQAEARAKEQQEREKRAAEARALAKADTEAKAKLKLAKQFADDATLEFAKLNHARANDLKKSAIERLKGIIKDYPNTDSAKEATKLLEKLSK